MNNSEIWCGCASIYDGFIEETHTYEEAKKEDFHHSLYFSIEAAERINEGESIFFWIENGKLYTEWRNEETSQWLTETIKTNLTKIKENKNE